MSFGVINVCSCCLILLFFSPRFLNDGSSHQSYATLFTPLKYSRWRQYFCSCNFFLKKKCLNFCGFSGAFMPTGPKFTILCLEYKQLKIILISVFLLPVAMSYMTIYPTQFYPMPFIQSYFIQSHFIQLAPAVLPNANLPNALRSFCSLI